MRAPNERRRVQRVRLIQPLRGTVGEQKIFVLDVSLLGLRIVHQEPLGNLRDECRLIFEWQGGRIELRCRIVRSELQRPVSGPSRTLYHSGLEIVFAPPQSREHLAALIHDHVSRAVDEQKANARGIPAASAQHVQTGAATSFVRHDYIRGQWQTTQTNDPTQPMSGFTISTDETPDNISMLRDAFIAADPSLRHVIRKMAELSISNPAGIPARRYAP